MEQHLIRTKDGEDAVPKSIQASQNAKYHCVSTLLADGESAICSITANRLPRANRKGLYLSMGDGAGLPVIKGQRVNSKTKFSFLHSDIRYD